MWFRRECCFEGTMLSLGNNVVIEPNCVIKDAEIGDNRCSCQFSHIEGAT